MTVFIRKAGKSDTEGLMGLRHEAASWLHAAGIDQWNDPRTARVALSKWELDIASGRTYVVESRDELLATVTLAKPDTDFWRPSDDLDDATYVAKLITSRKAAGKSLGGRLLDWAGSQARARGQSWLRLDCWRTNGALQEFYLREGFVHVRTEAPDHRLSGWLAQRPAGMVRYPEAQLQEKNMTHV
ncbi:GNAT family N-acetyltransferase [Streptomyces sp. TG1A-8]|uniref:GNAT family N-acetyltransferase n=1 Tax=Streptomyces sp. TG1A-8 TaxID=3051385 RepID=UPI00265BAD36|nr:GNAT family N-acetyltransferase [Streptomyces sp. TG1A-8]MDO0929744.1 GNAT family N-acetyltransferase [Streptomyces sp. TG1A-8]